MPVYFIYPIYTVALMLIALAIVPRKEIRHLAFYGILIGAFADVFVIFMLRFTGAGGFINYGPFGFMGLPFFPPLSWTAFFILYFYFLPEHKPWIYIYPAIAAGYSALFSNVLTNLGIFTWNYGRVIVPYLTYFFWFAFGTWFYLKIIINYGAKNRVENIRVNTVTARSRAATNMVAVKKPSIWKKLRKKLEEGL